MSVEDYFVKKEKSFEKNKMEDEAYNVLLSIFDEVPKSFHSSFPDRVLLEKGIISEEQLIEPRCIPYHFIHIPLAVAFMRGIGPIDKLVFAFLATMSVYMKGVTFPSADYIGKFLGRDASTIRRAIKKLKNLGLIYAIHGGQKRETPFYLVADINQTFLGLQWFNEGIGATEKTLAGDTSWQGWVANKSSLDEYFKASLEKMKGINASKERENLPVEVGSSEKENSSSNCEKSSCESGLNNDEEELDKQETNKEEINHKREERISHTFASQKYDHLTSKENIKKYLNRQREELSIPSLSVRKKELLATILKINS